MNLVESIEPSADRWMDELIALRRRIHEHPELAFEEHETAKRVQEFLARLAIPCRTGIGGTGIVALLAGGKPGPTVAIRADMDALPMSEPAGLPFASKVPGKMHSCGHDAHTAIALGVAAVLAEQREHLGGRVMFIFQPAEETLSGARAMLEAGAFDQKPDAILGFHNWPPLATGTVGWHPEAVMASSDAFDVTIKGTAGHGAASAPCRRCHHRRGAIRQSGTNRRQPRDRADQLGGRDHRPHQRRHRAQHHRVVGGNERLGAHAGIRDRREDRSRGAPDPGRTQDRIARRLRAQMDQADAGAEATTSRR